MDQETLNILLCGMLVATTIGRSFLQSHEQKNKNIKAYKQIELVRPLYDYFEQNSTTIENYGYLMSAINETNISAHKLDAKKMALQIETHLDALVCKEIKLYLTSNCRPAPVENMSRTYADTFFKYGRASDLKEI